MKTLVKNTPIIYVRNELVLLHAAFLHDPSAGRIPGKEPGCHFFKPHLPKLAENCVDGFCRVTLSLFIRMNYITDLNRIFFNAAIIDKTD